MATKQPKSDLQKYILVDGKEEQKRRKRSKKQACSLILAASQCVLFCGAAVGLVLYLIEHGDFNTDSNNRDFNTYLSNDLQQLFNVTHNYGWLGGDIDTSIQLYDDHYIWLFGDSIIGRYDPSSQTRLRSNFSYLHSSIALFDRSVLYSSLSTDGSSQSSLISNAITFMWRSNASNHYQPSSFFTSSISTNLDNSNSNSNSNTKTFWRVTSGVSNNDSNNCSLFLAAGEISNNDGTTPYNYNIWNYNFINTIGIVVNNINDETLNDALYEWKYKYKQFPMSNSSLNWFVGIVKDPIDDNIVYILGLNSQNGKNMISKGDISDLMNLDLNSFRSYGYDEHNDLSWHVSSDLKQFEYILETKDNLGLTQIQLEYSNNLQRWYAFVMGPEDDGTIRLYESKNDKIESKYSYNEIYNIPKPWNDEKTYYTYSVQSHPELINYIKKQRENGGDTSDDDDNAADGDVFDEYLVFSYVTNAWNLTTLFQDGEGQTYLPQMVVYEY